MTVNDDAGGPTPSSRRPPDYRPRALHLALLFTDAIGRVHPLALTPAWLALSAIAAWPWSESRPIAGMLAIVLTMIDGAGLALRPVRGRSFGPVAPPMLAIACMRTALILGVGLIWDTPYALAIAGGLVSLGSVLFLYATWIEPFRIAVTRAELRSTKLAASEPLRILHVSDLHVERITPRERALITLVADLAPDLIVLTGDYLNLSYVTEELAQSEAREVLGALCAAGSCPVYAVTGSPPVDLASVVPSVFQALPISWLHNEIVEVEIRGHQVELAGLGCRKERSYDVPRLQRLLDQGQGKRFRVLLYHSPDLMPEAAQLGVDLYLCGHTHGGQIRLPIFGAIITSSAFWKRYEMGRYELGGTTLYVNRGLGLEGMGAPRARLLAPPEVVLWELSS